MCTSYRSEGSGADLGGVCTSHRSDGSGAELGGVCTSYRSDGSGAMLVESTLFLLADFSISSGDANICLSLVVPPVARALAQRWVVLFPVSTDSAVPVQFCSLQSLQWPLLTSAFSYIRPVRKKYG